MSVWLFLGCRHILARVMIMMMFLIMKLWLVMIMMLRKRVVVVKNMVMVMVRTNAMRTPFCNFARSWNKNQQHLTCSPH